MVGYICEEVSCFVLLVSDWFVDVLYFVDSMGSMKFVDVCEIVVWLWEGWLGVLGFYVYDNMGLVLQNILIVWIEGVEWLDVIIIGMGCGFGNVCIEELLIEFVELWVNLVFLLVLIGEYFVFLKVWYGWGINVFYYFFGKYVIYLIYVQEMLGDLCYGEEDVFVVIDYLCW